MAEITGGELQYVATMDVSQLKSGLKDVGGNLMGFSDLAEKVGEALDGTFDKSANSIKNVGSKTVAVITELSENLLGITSGKIPENLKAIGLSSNNLGSEFEFAKQKSIEWASYMREGLLVELDNVQKRIDFISSQKDIQASVKLDVLSKEQLNLQDIQDAIARTDALTDAVKGLAAEQVNIAAQYLAARKRLAELNLELKEGRNVDAVEYKKASDEVERLGTVTRETNLQTKQLSQDGLSSLIAGMGTVAGGLSVAQSLVGLFGSENENLNKIMLKSQALMSVAVTLQGIYNQRTAQGVAGTNFLTTAKNFLTAANTRLAVALGISNVAATVLMATLTLGLSVAIAGAIILYQKFSSEQEKQAKNQKKLTEAFADEAATMLVSYYNLQNRWNSLGNDLKAKNQFVTDNKNEFKKLGTEVDNVSDAEKVLKSQSADFVKMMMLRAEAAANAQLAVEDFKESLKMKADATEELTDPTVWQNIKATIKGVLGQSVEDQINDAYKLSDEKRDEALARINKQKELEEQANALGFNQVHKADKKPKKEKAGKQLSEVFDNESVREIQQEIALLDGALVRVGKNGEVTFRALDKYGKEYATSQKGTIEQAKALRINAAERLAEAENKIATKSQQEQIDETKKSIELRDELLKNGYSKEVIDKMFPKIKDTSFFDYLENTRKSLEKIDGKQAAEDLITVQDVFNDFTGGKSFIDGINEKIETLKAKFSGGKLISELEKLKKASFENETEANKNAKGIVVDKAQAEELKRQKQYYEDFLKEKETFEQKKIAIDAKYKVIDEGINNSDKPENEKSELLTESAKAKGDEYASAFLDVFKRSDLWKRAFSDIANLTQREINRLIPQLQNQIKELLANGGSAADIKVIEDRIRALKKVSDDNPFQKLADSFKILNSDTATTEQKFDAAKNGLNAMGASIMEIGDAFGGFDDATNDAIGNIIEIGSSALDLGKSIASGDVAGMIQAGLKLIGSIGKAINGDQKKERDIKKQAAALKQLENAYNAVAFAAERMVGSQKYSGQRDLIKNLEQQKIALQAMANAEGSKKKKDQGKIDEYNQQMQAINQSIIQLKEGIIKDVLQDDLQGMASKIGDALLDAFSKGEDGIAAVNKAFDDMVKNILKNQLNKVLEKEMEGVYKNILAAAGFDKDGNGAFNGFTPEEIADLKAQIATAAANGQQFIDAYTELFGDANENAQGLKGDIKGITEKTAGALEAQINAMRINQVSSIDVLRASLVQLVLIEGNTRRLHNIDATLIEMNNKMKNGLAGI
ncbi:hypothetical protein Q73A0000_01345 [Kaistella flava (ex Peng et al. 2021)]|uniref:Phage tail tape measure protein n=1 Tax=Kaistella flava (ex Peng et al. 2021) TaxID=2038776 RepID=A0A7M2Y4D3_9FLAO|nr:hypothetical protein [Kaistella flava (ex Peng et al. 2021)]QOW09087.1 hypothetical protein Q73A0000_01345 [Kaistella flava (ex Peng et al. 2021)]